MPELWICGGLIEMKINIITGKVYCAYCGKEVTEQHKTAEPPVYKTGEKKGQPIKCCEHPDWRYCGSSDCEDENPNTKTCLGCGMYFGQIVW